jgi:hemerythrin
MSDRLLISWGPDNEIGIPIIDEQHRGIVSLINTFEFSTQHDQQTEFYLNTIFTMMDGYTKLHFATEEEFLRLAGYAELEQHKESHAALIKKSFAVAGKSMRLRDPDIYLQFLKEWWMTHINHCDRLYASTLKKHFAA